MNVRDEILQALREDGRGTAASLARKTGRSPSTALKYLRELQGADMARRAGKLRGADIYQPVADGEREAQAERRELADQLRQMTGAHAAATMRGTVQLDLTAAQARQLVLLLR